MGLQRYGLYICWFLACIGTLISLYYSHIRLLEPCNLCWYQRVCLFPLVWILGISAYRGWLSNIWCVLPLTSLGFLCALYQIGIQEIPHWNPIDICGHGPSCIERITVIGPITVPMLSATLFLTLSLLLFKTHRKLALQEDYDGR